MTKEVIDIWDGLFDYIGFTFVIGTMLVILYFLAIVTLLIRKLIAPEYGDFKISLKTHKYILLSIGIVFLFGLTLFLLALWPAILAILVLYIFFRHIFPLIAKRLI